MKPTTAGRSFNGSSSANRLRNGTTTQRSRERGAVCVGVAHVCTLTKMPLAYIFTLFISILNEIWGPFMAWDWEKLQQQKKPRSGGPPPQVNEILNRFRGAKGKFPGLWLIIIAILVFYVGSSTIYTVAVDEVGIVQRFGQYVRTTPPGLNFKLPRGIEKVTKVKVRYVYKEEFGFRTIQAGVRTRYASGSAYLSESLMLTGDLNVAVVPWIVQFRIKEPYKYLFKVRDVRTTLRDLSEPTMRLVVGDRSINEVISKREEIAAQAEELLQKELESWIVHPDHSSLKRLEASSMASSTVAKALLFRPVPLPTSLPVL